MRNEITQYGFNFGSMEVTRTSSGGDGVAIISVKTPRAKFSIRTTKTGQIKFYDQFGDECELINKEFTNK